MLPHVGNFSFLTQQAQSTTAAEGMMLYGEAHYCRVNCERLLQEPLTCDSAYFPMDVVTSKASNMSTEAVPDQMDILQLKERDLL